MSRFKPKDLVWQFFVVTRDKAKCKDCHTVVSARVLRLRNHKLKCPSTQNLPHSIRTPQLYQVENDFNDEQNLKHPCSNVLHQLSSGKFDVSTKHTATQTDSSYNLEHMKADNEEKFEDPITTFEAGCTHIVFGQSGSGKTQFIYKVLQNRQHVFNGNYPVKIRYYYGIWQDLFTKIEREIDDISFHQGLPTEEELLSFTDPNIHTLIIIDDLMQEACNSQVVELIFTRLSHHRLLTCFYLLQNPFVQGKVQSTINTNTKYIEIFRSPRSLMQLRYLNSQLFPDSPGLLVEAYNDAMNCDKYGYLVIDLTPHCPDDIRIRTKIFPGEQTFVYKND